MDQIIDVKAGFTWIVSAVMVFVNDMLGDSVQGSTNAVVDVLTIMSLIVAIGYTATRWYFLIKDKQKKKK